MQALCSFTALHRNTDYFRLYLRLTDWSHTNGLPRLPKYHSPTIQACSREVFECATTVGVRQPTTLYCLTPSLKNPTGRGHHSLKFNYVSHHKSSHPPVVAHWRLKDLSAWQAISL
ncbi:hypothetical protein WJX77_008317 [Trebouxia sp. C0004]